MNSDVTTEFGARRQNSEPPIDDDFEEITVVDQRRGDSLEPCREQVYLFMALDCERPQRGGTRIALGNASEVVFARASEPRVWREPNGRLVVGLCSKLVSRRHALLTLRAKGWWVVDKHSTNGTFVDGVRVTQSEFNHDQVLQIGSSFLMLRTLRLRDEPLGDNPETKVSAPAALRTLCPILEQQYQTLQQIAVNNMPVLLSGASGVGKEVTAKALHDWSGKSGPFVALNCGALAHGLTQAQLFGHVRGAFSGAVCDAPGFVRAAHQGTLFLDEIEDLDPAGQVALLRVLQEHEVTPIGTTRPVRVDLRVIGASRMTLASAVAAGRFREDLYSRLLGFQFQLPLLLERRQDLGLLIALLLPRIAPAASSELSLSPEYALALLRHHWPLNIRELEQSLRRSHATARDKVLQLDPLTSIALNVPSSTKGSNSSLITLTAKQAAETALRTRLVTELAEARGNVARVARAFNKAPIQVHRWMRRFAIDPESFRNEPTRTPPAPQVG